MKKLRYFCTRSRNFNKQKLSLQQFHCEIESFQQFSGRLLDKPIDRCIKYRCIKQLHYKAVTKPITHYKQTNTFFNLNHDIIANVSIQHQLSTERGIIFLTPLSWVQIAGYSGQKGDWLREKCRFIYFHMGFRLLLYYKYTSFRLVPFVRQHHPAALNPVVAVEVVRVFGCSNLNQFDQFVDYVIILQVRFSWFIFRLEFLCRLIKICNHCRSIYFYSVYLM